ncbi:polyamine-transporting ATPase 13A3 isoform X3 [Culicoides brevitarsis]|uniref:polyamine-transporting ATPase 13A3 isoform X3 n=1 Tax=Culicoides brevitarsis TaxID=469753 RepID=UPI00307BD38E
MTTKYHTFETNQLRASCSAKLQCSQDDEIYITGYKHCRWRAFLCYTSFVLTLGLLRLVMHWWSHWHLIATHTKCPLDCAEMMLITEHYQGKHTIYHVKKVFELNANTIAKMKDEGKFDDPYEDIDEKGFQLAVHLNRGIFKYTDSVRYFICKKLRYIWDPQMGTFLPLRGLDMNVPSTTLHHQKGLSEQEQYARRLIYGFNQIVIPMRGILTLLFLEVLNPFYVFQVFSVCLWFSYDYYYYASVIILMSGFGITLSIIQTRKNQQALHSTVANSDTACVLRANGKSEVVDTKILVPGDILEIPSNGCTMQCDAVLLSGNCILDESMLTGESVPVTKTPLPCKKELIFDTKEHARHTLFCGTKVIQTRYIGSEKVLAVVINTGNITAKGGLIRSILYPPPVDYKFEQDSYKFVFLLGCVATLGFLYTLVTKIMRGLPSGKILVESLDLVTIAVPPALPAAMTVGRMYAQQRLKKKNIYCISPRSINVSGSVDCVCFDKTGTLTEDGLDMWGVVPKSCTNMFQIPLRQIERLPNDHLLYGMVTCHSITLMQGEMKGDPLDLKMFESTQWILEEPNVSDDTKFDLVFPTIVRPPNAVEIQTITGEFASLEIGIVREFSFTSSLQRMSVITRRLCDQHFNVYCKGSPEMISTLCRPDTIPIDFHQKLNIYAQQGYRIIAIAYKPLATKVNYPKIQRISREKIECDLEFLGFVILENRLKADTTSVISSLMKANIRTIMVTGDNILTALSVAKDCGMITKGQNVIIVNSRQNNMKANGHELYYNLSGQGNGESKSPTEALTPNGCGGDYALMSNSNSMASIQTVDTFTQTTSVSLKDVEAGFKIDELEGRMEHDKNNYRFAMTGKTWAMIREYFPDLVSKFVTRGTIFARMSPDQKQQLVMELQDLGYYVAMCGDGANDCGALKAAHTGISLSDAESSVASPFTSRNPTIACVPSIVKEGRAALVTSFGIFKYMAAYSLVQFASVIILYSIDSNLTDWEYLYIDLFMISIFAFFFGKTESYDGPLTKQAPLNSLIAMSPIASLALHLIVAISFQIIGWYHVKAQPWFEPFVFTEDKEEKNQLGCHENYTIFVISCFQYIILAFVFSKGAPYRKSVISNYGFLISILVNTTITVYIALFPSDWLAEHMGLVVPPDMNFRLTLIGYGIVSFIIALIIEMLIIEYFLSNKLRYKFHNIHKSHKKFLAIENDLRRNPNWPPISSLTSEILPNIDDKSSPMSFAELSVVENTDVDATTLEQSSILNSFFEQYEELDDVMVDHPSSESKSSPEPKSPSISSVLGLEQALPGMVRARQDSGIELGIGNNANGIKSPVKGLNSSQNDAQVLLNGHDDANNRDELEMLNINSSQCETSYYTKEKNSKEES